MVGITLFFGCFYVSVHGGTLRVHGSKLCFQHLQTPLQPFSHLVRTHYALLPPTVSDYNKMEEGERSEHFLTVK